MIASPKALLTAASPGVPGSTTWRANRSALTTGTPDSAHAAATVDFPDAMLPVSATLYIAPPFGWPSTPTYPHPS